MGSGLDFLRSPRRGRTWTGFEMGKSETRNVAPAFRPAPADLKVGATTSPFPRLPSFPSFRPTFLKLDILYKILYCC